MLTTEDILAIHELMALYGNIIDDRQFSRIHEVFTEKSIYDVSAIVSGRVIVGADAIREYWVEMENAQPLSHHATNVLISEDPDGTVRVSSKGIGVREKGPITNRRYDDIVGGTSKGWRILKRVAWRRNSDNIPQCS